MTAVLFHFAQDLDAVDGLIFDPNGPDGNVFALYHPDQPDLSFAVMAAPGRPNLTRQPDDWCGVQIIGRGPAHQPHPVLALMGLIYDRYQARDGWELAGAVDSDGTALNPVWVSGCTSAAGIMPIGRDPLDRPEFSLTFTLLTNQPTTHRP